MKKVCYQAHSVLRIPPPHWVGNLDAYISIVNFYSTNYRNVFKLGDDAARGITDFIHEVKEPAVRMVKLYLAQAIMTATYIYSLACVGRSYKGLWQKLELISTIISELI